MHARIQRTLTEEVNFTYIIYVCHKLFTGNVSKFFFYEEYVSIAEDVNIVPGR